MSCDIKSGVCERSITQNVQGAGQCHCRDCKGEGDHIECKRRMWECSFQMAMKAAQVEILKEKIKKSWGTKLDKEANAVLEVMEAKWRSVHAAEQATMDLKYKLEEICKENK